MDCLKRRLSGHASGLPPAPPEGFALTHASQFGLSDHLIAAAAGESLGIKTTDTLSEMPVLSEFVSRVPISYARRHSIVALRGHDGRPLVAISRPHQIQQVQILGQILGRDVEALLAPSDEILRVINAAYQQRSGQAQEVIEQLDRDGEDLAAELGRMVDREDLLDVASRAPVIRLVNLLLFEAVKRRASDVHVQPYEDRLVIRFRIDGVLYDVFKPPRSLQEEIVSRIKVMGGMNIAERRLAQDGRTTVQVGEKIVDLRIATLPTCFGERVVIRLLDKSARLHRLGELGMPSDLMQQFCDLVHADHGIVLVSGPTGSGKSTTLYAALLEINTQEFNVITLEDPIEYRLEGISQTQVSDRKGMTFASGLRHVLRQDPDIIMVGEIRDVETAHMAIQSALTGHMVFSTLHTNDAAGAVARMLDLGVEPYLLASSLLGVLAQRLVRRICPKCKTAFEPEAFELAAWGIGHDELPSRTLFRGHGCDDCMNSGYRERIGIFELLTTNEAIRDQILHQARASSLKQAAITNGMMTMRHCGLQKACAGITSLQEVARVAGRNAV